MQNFKVFPKRGNPPACPKGYQPTGDPYIFQLAFPSCKLRKTEISTCKFKRDVTVHRCQYLNELVSPRDCHGCPLTHSQREFMVLHSVSIEKLKQEFPKVDLNMSVAHHD